MALLVADVSNGGRVSRSTTASASEGLGKKPSSTNGKTALGRTVGKTSLQALLSKRGGQTRSQNPLTNIGINDAISKVPPNSNVAQALKNLEDGKPTPADLAVLKAWINSGTRWT
jgi:hypothetical protein